MWKQVEKFYVLKNNVRWLLGWLIFSLLLSSCTAASTVWGVRATPTAMTPFVPPTPVPTATPFQPMLETPQPTPTPNAGPPTPVPTPQPVDNPPILYYSQAGDWLPAVAARFGVDAAEIQSADTLNADDFLPPDTLLVIPNVLGETGPADLTIPDSDVVYSPSAADFDAAAYARAADGHLAQYRQYLGSTAWIEGPEEVARVALENSINPRILLALLEYESGWVRGAPSNLAQEDYPLGYVDYYYKGLFRQMMWAVEQLSIGYYGWRAGLLTEVTLQDGTTVHLAPGLNAGTVAVQYYFAQTRDYEGWLQALDPNVGFPALFADMFGDPWLRAQTVEPLFPPTLKQPPMALPFAVGETWVLTGGPHAPWEHAGALAALDFAPPTAQKGCAVSDRWVLAIAPGRVVRLDKGLVVVDMDDDGYEQTGWDVLYLHIATEGRQVALNDWVNTGDALGHPSCEGGVATGTHVHLARKYNGEWMLADGPVPFNLSGWVAHNGAEPYQGSMTKGDRTVTASLYGSYESRITHNADE